MMMMQIRFLCLPFDLLTGFPSGCIMLESVADIEGGSDYSCSD
jgi:hypothetical protein